MNLKITNGITAAQTRDLIHYSNNDPLILENTTDKTRFGDQKAVDSWIKKNRRIYTLTGSKGKLFGVVWFGREKIPSVNFSKKINPEAFEITFGIRLYGQARGKGLAEKFFNDGLNFFRKTDEYKKIKNKKVWLATNKNNALAISFYRKLGFGQVGATGEKILMIEI